MQRKFKEINNHSFKSGDCDVKISLNLTINDIKENTWQKQTIENEIVDENLNKTIKDETEDCKEPSKTSIQKFNLSGNTCPDCNKYFEKSRYMKQHYQNVHRGIPTKCKVCQKEFLSRSRMLAHVNLVHNAVPKKCSDCGKSFSNATNLKTHCDSFHKGIKYKCDKCDYVATQRGHLKEHTLSKHEGIVYTCNLCDRKYSQKKALKKHKCTSAEMKIFDSKNFKRNRDHLHNQYGDFCPS